MSLPSPFLRRCSGCRELLEPPSDEGQFGVQTNDGRAWHSGCLVCAQCQCPLYNSGDVVSRCYAKGGQVYCRKDYICLFEESQLRRSTSPCLGCRQPLLPGNLIMHSPFHTFHFECFSCYVCGTGLLPGQPYLLHNDSPVCLHDFIQLQQKTPPPGDCTKEIAPALSQRRIRRAEHFTECLGNLLASESFFTRPKAVLQHSPLYLSSRQKRVRTSFKHQQLRSMKAFFAKNHNPDAKDLKGLSEVTGLSKRVLQVRFQCDRLLRVWFQNARAKYRRSVGGPDTPRHSSGADSRTHSPGNSTVDTAISGEYCLRLGLV
ncbi:unnamed protein product [Mesocestoides corti]|uniref:LIM zinc-binding domain-containing protein n=1 Tax=Mesocestoides corti TaxID=53468 RepID=A0A0R3U1V3_MESCO|nr:unnamed protein product [Mesocestoides corti]